MAMLCCGVGIIYIIMKCFSGDNFNVNDTALDERQTGYKKDTFTLLIGPVININSSTWA